MFGDWTIGRKVGVGFAVTVGLAGLLAVISVLTLRRIVADKDRVMDTHASALVDAQGLSADIAQKNATALRHLLAPSAGGLEELRGHRAAFLARMTRLRVTLPPDQLGELDELGRREQEHQLVLERVLAMRNKEQSDPTATAAYVAEVLPLRVQMRAVIDRFVRRQEAELEAARARSDRETNLAVMVMVAVAAVAAVVASVLASRITGGMTRQIGGSVADVQGSSAELQAAANQQAAGAKEQASAMTEVATTLSELLATSRQIAESAQRVARVAEQTSGAGRAGEATLQSGRDSATAMRRQVDLIVQHMVELGRRSQEIGGVLDIVSELADQTNILAINATIEAAGAGESGKRFSVVAEEIRKLADRVGSSANDVRGLVEDVRASVNTTVMTTETGSKAVDAAARQLDDLVGAFKNISGMVITTTEAAREIELSTKQQATAVEQVNLAISNVAQATRESEATSGQILKTATQLSDLSRGLLRMVRSAS
jgi:methyl-accepting chemotaxis protein